MSGWLEHINGSKVALGVGILLANVGGRFIAMELGRVEEKLLASPIARRVVIFCVVFVATRDVAIAAVVTLLFVLFTKRGTLFGREGPAADAALYSSLQN